ncbi:aminotransferase class I/II-fold pyridoxal phosphate-dependent enzyme [Vagococcus coleopterorum]|uniref:cysteine-S-conjugate beta-lyase n=1 Tax=Vagococcus coleopterorum TaxID=2714946 RepID=A0A6G8AM53_9ENTE|nr:aminotransferase class I/II-fold pyridoxal phosphate-dependent enzyme [Vagococcus coleopterorum]QIL46164.1 aminotransferase class I/II-fold pyridoxal phosphate-dependent enzyme [Vagococcus coleopterorum]
MLDNTKLLHGYPVVDQFTGAASIPKYQASTFNQKEILGTQDYTYTRFGNPTVAALEEGIATLEGAKFGFAFSSGMAAISTVLMLLKAGEHVILPLEVYGGTCQFVNDILPNYNIEASFVDCSDIEAVKAAVKPNTKMLYIETPSNPLLKVTDIKAMVEIAKANNLMTALDNTFMTPLYQKPLEMGVDMVIESATKFLNGHSDVVAGLLATNDEELAATLKVYQKSFGGILGVEDSWLILRGMKTMGIRMEKSVQNATAIAEYMAKHPKVKNVFYPGLASHPNHDVHMSQAANGGAVLSFELADENAVADFSAALNVPIIAVSLGGVESIVSYPRTMSHACISEEERQEQGVTQGLLRFSCGIEDTEDLLADLEAALAKVK